MNKEHLLNLLRNKFPKATRRRMICWFVKHRYWLNQGNSSVASLPWPPLEKMAVVGAVAKYLLGDHINNWWILVGFGVYCIWRFGIRWVIGWAWHGNNGYDIETEWNRGKVPPSRVEVINVDELAQRVAKLIRNGE